MNFRLLLTLTLLALGSSDFAAGFGYLPKVESASPPRRTPVETTVVPTAESVLELLGVLNLKSIFDGLVERQKDYLRAELEQDPARDSFNSQQQAILPLGLQGAAAAAAKSKEIIGVNFKPREIAGVCEFFNSPQGKHISAQMPKAMSQLQAGVVDMAKDTEIRMRAMAAEFESRIEAVADPPAAVTSK